MIFCRYTKRELLKEGVNLDPVAIGKRQIALRGNRTQTEVAKDVGISVAAIFMYEIGERVPRDEVKVLLARYYNQTVGALFFNEKVHET